MLHKSTLQAGQRRCRKAFQQPNLCTGGSTFAPATGLRTFTWSTRWGGSVNFNVDRTNRFAHHVFTPMTYRGSKLGATTLGFGGTKTNTTHWIATKCTRNNFRFGASAPAMSFMRKSNRRVIIPFERRELRRVRGEPSSPSPFEPFRRYQQQWRDPILLILGINGVVYLMWHVDSLRVTMRKHFTCSMHNIKEGRVWTLLTASVSHISFIHLLFNSVAFYSLGNPVLALLGPSRFIGLCIGSALMTSVTHLLYTNYIKINLLYSHSPPLVRWSQRNQAAYESAVGMSGVGFAVSVVFAYHFPKETLLLFGIIPAPAAWLIGAAVLYTAYNILHPSVDSNIGHAGHMGGALYGALYLLYLRSKRRLPPRF